MDPNGAPINDNDKVTATKLVAEFDETYSRLCTDANRSYWNASISGKEEDWEAYEAALQKPTTFLSNRAMFSSLKSVAPKTRELHEMYHLLIQNQVDPGKLNQIASLASEIEKTFNTFRAEFAGKRWNDNEISDVLKASTNSAELEGVWTAHKKLGRLVAPKVLRLVKLRNQVAKELGFHNFHEMTLKANEQVPAEIDAFFDQLDDLTKEHYFVKKGEIDTFFATKQGVSITELRPWHYQDFYLEEPPMIYPVDYDGLFKGRDLAEITARFYKGIGLDVEGVMKRSDLIPKEGKCQSSFCLSVDRRGDIRVLCNNTDNVYSMAMMMHEFGHATYEQHIDPSLPFILRDPSILTTEAIAILFERITYRPSWLQPALGLTPVQTSVIETPAQKTFALGKLVFARWSQVMYRFEKGLYEDPEQDLNGLWWKLTEKYQGIKAPPGRDEPDWAAKSHIANATGYYHNYLLGECLASQLNAWLTKNVLHSTDVYSMKYAGRKEIGEFLKEKVFKVGRSKHWKEVVQFATGEDLTPAYFVKEIEMCLK